MDKRFLDPRKHFRDHQHPTLQGFGLPGQGAWYGYREVEFKDLYVHYGDIGEDLYQRGGIRGALGINESLTDRRFIDVAERLSARLPSLAGAPQVKAVERIRSLMRLGVDGILSLDVAEDIEPRTIRETNGKLYIIHGNHRAFALYLLGQRATRVLDITSPLYLGNGRDGSN